MFIKKKLLGRNHKLQSERVGNHADRQWLICQHGKYWSHNCNATQNWRWLSPHRHRLSRVSLYIRIFILFYWYIRELLIYILFFLVFLKAQRKWPLLQEIFVQYSDQINLIILRHFFLFFVKFYFFFRNKTVNFLYKLSY